MLALGARVDWVAPLMPLLLLHGVVLHADVPWRYGAVGNWIVSPLFHRWHHAKHLPSAEGGARVDGVNFGGIFTFWDRVFGTFYLPASSPEETGVRGEAVPEGFLAQLVHPFRRAGAFARGPWVR